MKAIIKVEKGSFETAKKYWEGERDYYDTYGECVKINGGSAETYCGYHEDALDLLPGGNNYWEEDCTAVEAVAWLTCGGNLTVAFKTTQGEEFLWVEGRRHGWDRGGLSEEDMIDWDYVQSMCLDKSPWEKGLTPKGDHPIREFETDDLKIIEILRDGEKVVIIENKGIIGSHGLHDVTSFEQLVFEQAVKDGLVKIKKFS